jgi:hypothetical protein
VFYRGKLVDNKVITKVDKMGIECELKDLIESNIVYYRNSNGWGIRFFNAGDSIQDKIYFYAENVVCEYQMSLLLRPKYRSGNQVTC